MSPGSIDPAVGDEGGPLGADMARTSADGSIAPPQRPSTPELGLATATVVVGFAGLTACLVVFGSVAEGVRSQEVFALDAWASPFLHGISSPGMDAAMNGATDLGTILVILPVLVAFAAWLLRTGHVRSVVFLIVAMIGSLVLQWAMKLFFARPRPELAWSQVLSDYSFPSGHTLNAVVFYGGVALVVWSLFGRRAGLAAVAAAAIVGLAVGVSRIYLGYHYLTDVVGGILAGIAWLLVVGAAFRARPTWRRWRSRGGTVRRSAGTGPGAMASR
jgi:undecaprenyl-diphosphatase